MPGRKLPRKLEQLERAGANLLHNSQAVAAGRGGRSPAPAGSPHPCRRAWQQGSGTRRELRATPETGAPDPPTLCRHPKRRHRLSDSDAAVPRARLGALGVGLG